MKQDTEVNFNTNCIINKSMIQKLIVKQFVRKLRIAENIDLKKKNSNKIQCLMMQTQSKHMIVQIGQIINQYYLEAQAFLKVSDKDFLRIENQFKELKQLISSSMYQNVDIQKQLLEYLRDYNVCTSKDFVKEYNLQIQDRSQDDFSYSFHKDKNNIIKPVNLLQQDISLLQLSSDWVYYDYPPITKQECNEEFPMIKEDILQFQKIQTLDLYQTKYQNSYDQLIAKVLQMKKDFLDYASKGRDFINKLDFSKRLRFFNNYPKNLKTNNHPEILDIFDKIHDYINKLGTLDKQQSACIWLYNYDEASFKQLELDQLILNDYLNKRFHYKMNEVDKELSQLYRDFQICAGKSYFERTSPNNDQFEDKPEKRIAKKSQLKHGRRDKVKQINLNGQKSHLNFKNHHKGLNKFRKNAQNKKQDNQI
ncbi:hypothetical protein pb186bvf_014664 [Paramecium bursaria]